jgi:hypothetical protein
VTIVDDVGSQSGPARPLRAAHCSADYNEITAIHADIFTCSRLKLSAMPFASFVPQA